MNPLRMRLPALLVVGVLGIAVGVALGVVGMALLGYSPLARRGGGPQPAPGAPAMGGMGAPGMGGGMGAPGMGGGGGGRGPNPKAQLASLVAKLDQLTRKPLTVTLSDEQRQKLHQLLQGLDEKEDLDETEAKKCLEAVLEIVKEDRDNLEAAGYRWPGQRAAFRPPADPPNPFRE